MNPNSESTSTTDILFPAIPLEDDLIAAENAAPDSYDDDGWFDDDSFAFVASLLSHVVVVLFLALFPLLQVQDKEAIVLISPPPEEKVALIDVEEVVVSDLVPEDIGANGLASSDVSAASAEMLSEIAEIPSPIEPIDFGSISVAQSFAPPVAPINHMIQQNGSTGAATSGAAGAVDRLTQEIIQSMEDRPTLVVWLFDKSASLLKQRKRIRDRFDRIYEEIGILQTNQEPIRRKDKSVAPLLTAVFGFGEKVELLTDEPTDDLATIQETIDGIEVDSSGVEKVFSAVYLAVKEFQPLRRSRGTRGPRRNVMLVVVTDERGDDFNGLEATVTICRKWGIPVYVIGVPAPFGREQTFVKYVDPDPEYDQSPQWAVVNQGPETPMSERISLEGGFMSSDPVMDSGFGPYALTRLCYETGGVYFAVHPNRNIRRRVSDAEIKPYASHLSYFFDPAVMAMYRPDYLPEQEYRQAIEANPLRKSLTRAAQFSGAKKLDRPRVRFLKRSEATFVQELGVAQQAAAILEPKLIQLHAILIKGQPAREEEISPRWQAGYDLALGQVIAQKVRTETYNAMLAKAKRGIHFKKKKNNTWVLTPSADVSVGSKLKREAAMATKLLESVVKDHDGTPWSVIARNELKVPFSWKWKETYTEPPKPNEGGGGGGPPEDDEKKVIPRKVKRPLPKL